MASLATVAKAAMTVVFLSGCGFLTPLPEPTDAADRLAALKRDGLPLRAPVTIYWNDHLIPFIEASSDEDLAVALGIVHAHLRLGQMELLRRISQGRLAEIGGPLATDIDHALRILNVGRAVPEILAAMPADTRAWLDAFVRGVNAYVAGGAELPHEHKLLGLKPEVWAARGYPDDGPPRLGRRQLVRVVSTLGPTRAAGLAAPVGAPGGRRARLPPRLTPLIRRVNSRCSATFSPASADRAATLSPSRARAVPPGGR